jgi:hypothetical protein
MPFFSDFLASLSKAARAALPAIRGLAQSELSPSKIVDALRAGGVAIRTQDALDAVAVLRGNVAGNRAIRLTPNNQILNPDNFTPYPGNLNRVHGFQVILRGIDVNGLPRNQDMLLTYNEPPTKQEVLDLAMSYAFGKGESGDFQAIDSIELTDAYNAPSLGG